MTLTTTDSTPLPTETPAAQPRQPRRTLNRLAWAGAALGLAAGGQYFFSQNSVWDGLLLYLAAAILFVRAVGYRLDASYRLSLTNPRQADTLRVHTGWWRNVGLWLMLVGVGISGLSYNFFGQDATQLQAWWLYLASLGMFIAGGVLLTPGPNLDDELRRLFPRRAIGYSLALIMLLALFMRLYNFTEQPFGIWFDEAEAGLQARQILQDATYRPIFYPAINVTGHFLAVYASALAWLGDNIYSLRLVSVLFGLGGVLAAFLLGAELRGPRFGLALAFFLAVARWHVNFSRIAMTGVDTPFFELISLYFLTRLFRRGQLRDAMWAGLSLGLGLLFYTAFRLYLVALLLFALVAVLRWWKPLWASLRERGWLRWAGAATLLAVSVWLVVMPLVEYAQDNPEAFWYRTRQISILTKRDQPELDRALWESTRRHLLMFNVAGDRNGRHNLPGEPMLDALMGMLLLLGLALAVARTRHPANTFFLILLPVSLLGGILSLDFEAPQSLRSIAALPAVIYFCGLTTAALGREAEQALQPLPRAWLVGPAAALAGFIIVANGYTYFWRQANDFASWNAFSAPETITGRKMADLGADYIYYLSPFLTNHPTTRFLAPGVTHQKYLETPDALPIRDPSGRPVALFIHPDDQWIYSQARRLYPDATFEVLAGPPAPEQSSGPPSVYFVSLRPENLMSVRGLELRYFPPAEAEPASTLLFAPINTLRVFNVNVVWPEDSPLETDFEAEWSGVLYVPQYGVYGLRLETPAGGLLEIDGNQVLAGQGTQQVALALAEGNHALRLRAPRGDGAVALYWQPPGQPEQLIPQWAFYSRPVTNHGLLGTYYPNNDWAGPPAFQRIDPFLDTYFHLVPLQRPYTVEWAGVLVAPQSGVYRLGLRAVQEAQLYLDGQFLLATSGPDQLTEAPATLEAGLHEILIRYRDTVDRSRIHLTWVPPMGGLEAVPSEYLWPPMGSYPLEATPQPPAPEAVGALQLDYLTSVGLTPGSEPGQFIEPRDVAVMSGGNLVVADTINRRVQIFDPQHNFLLALTGDEFPFEEPLAVAVLPTPAGDQILVLDSTLQWVYRYDAAGAFIDRFGGPEARLFHPRGLTVFEDNTIAVSDTGTARVVLFDAEGQLTGWLGAGTPGGLPGQFNEPTDAARDSAGTYFVVEAENSRLQRLDAGGNPLGQWAIPPAFAYNGPHLALAPDGSILMTESQSRSLLRYSAAGNLLEQWSGLGPVEFSVPVGIYLDEATNRLYITDVGTHQVHVFQVTPNAG